MSKEHVIPKHKKGVKKVIRSACKWCNSEKGGKSLESYIDFLKQKFYKEKDDEKKVFANRKNKKLSTFKAGNQDT